ncbi:SRPBCC family protein [Actinophytocola xanthii]|uniref:Polyketide cyclase n=1 Tax=Actinophytocola xanthii TaxID=1912961 RepID=A0A1Q8CLS0_9PSEU|nr:SRPBCC domain-containing protein [Actinophytocola xanthii]OLF15297.1 polyketide cyclase [Actinophytocola xanthii]
MSETARELAITRVFDAPRELVFRCWTDPEQLVGWWGPTGVAAESVAVDVTGGGAWRIGMRNSADGAEYWCSGVYLEVVPPRRLVFSFAWDGEDAEDTLVTVTFAELDGKTEMTFHQTGFRTDESRDGHIEGWQSAFDDLVRHLGGAL